MNLALRDFVCRRLGCRRPRPSLSVLSAAAAAGAAATRSGFAISAETSPLSKSFSAAPPARRDIVPVAGQPALALPDALPQAAQACSRFCGRHSLCEHPLRARCNRAATAAESGRSCGRADAAKQRGGALAATAEAVRQPRTQMTRQSASLACNRAQLTGSRSCGGARPPWLDGGVGRGNAGSAAHSGAVK